jgi:trigger factor
VEITDESPLTLSALVPLQPSVDLGDYRTNLRLEVPEPEPVTEEDVEAVIDRLRADQAYLEPVERPAQDGDVVALSLVGRRDGDIVFDDEDLTMRLSAKGADSAHLPELVVAELLDHAEGDDIAFTLTYPADWPQPELQAQDVDFEARLAQVSEIMLPEADDAFASQVSDLDTIAELKDRIDTQLRARAEARSREEHVDTVIEALAAGATVSFPPALLESETARLFADLRERVKRQGFLWERWIELQNRDEDAVWAELEGDANDRLVRRLVLSAFVEQESISVAPDDLDNMVSALRASAAARNGPTPKEKDLRDQAASRLLADRALSRLLAIAGGEGVAAEAGDTDQRRLSESKPDVDATGASEASEPAPADASGPGSDKPAEGETAEAKGAHE